VGLVRAGGGAEDAGPVEALGESSADRRGFVGTGSHAGSGNDYCAATFADLVQDDA